MTRNYDHITADDIDRMGKQWTIKQQLNELIKEVDARSITIIEAETKAAEIKAAWEAI